MTEREVSYGSFAPFWLCFDVRFAPNKDRMADIRKRSKRANAAHFCNLLDYVIGTGK
jgi:hypothetical protein